MLPGGLVLKKLIDVGGMAGIFEADGPDGPVAIKLMRLDVNHQDILRDRFPLEREISRRVDHENCLQILDQGVSHKGEPFLVMELLEGQTVEEYWKEHDQKLPFIVALRIIRDILGPLAACHREGVIHRDLKPSNLFLANNGRAKLFDFGVSRVTWAPDNMAVKGAILGTPAYMAPEQAMGVADLDERSDLFSIGATVFALISGERVNDGQTADESFIIAATTPARSLAVVAPEVPIEVVQWVNKALAWERRDRFSNAEEMIAAVDDLLAREDELQEEARRRRLQTDFLTQNKTDHESSPAIERATALFQSIERVLRTVRTYGWGHRETSRLHRELFEQLTRELAKNEGILKLWVSPHTIEAFGAPVWEPEVPFDDIPYNLFVAGFRTISFLAGVSEGEVLELLRLVLLDPSDELELEDDLSTLFLEKNLENIIVELVSPLENIAMLEGFGTLSAAMEQVEDGVLASLEDENSGGTLRERVLHSEAEGMSVNVDEQVRLDNYQKVVDIVWDLSPEAKADLVSGFAQPTEVWMARLPAVVGQAIKEAGVVGDVNNVEDPLMDMISRWIHLGRFEGVAQLYEGLTEHLDKRQRLSLATKMLFGEPLKGLLVGLGQRSDGEENRSLDGIGRLFNDLGAGAIPTVIESLPQVSAPDLLPLLIGYLGDHFKQCEPQLQHLARTAKPELARRVIDVVVEQPAELALPSLRQATRSPYLNVRNQALEARLDLDDPKSAADMIHLMDSPSSPARIALLKIVCSRRVRAMDGYLRPRITDPGFHALPEDEREETLLAFFAINPNVGEELILDLIKRQGLVSNKSKDATRFVGLRVLGAVGCTEKALAATRQTAKSRWGSSKELRELAQHVSSEIEQRLGA